MILTVTADVMTGNRGLQMHWCIWKVRFRGRYILVLMADLLLSACQPVPTEYGWKPPEITGLLLLQQSIPSK